MRKMKGHCPHLRCVSLFLSGCCLSQSSGLITDFLLALLSPFLFPSQPDLCEFKTEPTLAMLTVFHAVGLTVPRHVISSCSW